MNTFATKRAHFSLPEAVIYLNGNSLGPVPAAVPARVQDLIARQWGEQLVSAWNQSDWIGLPMHVGDKIARLIGAQPGSVLVGDTLSIRLYQALAAAVQLRPKRRVILTDSGNFPTDLYIAQGLLQGELGDYQLRVVEPEQVAETIDSQVAVLYLTEVDYRSARLHNMADLTARAHAVGALTLWDLAHSVGALPIDLQATQVDFAVGCTYKYLNGGPGAPAFIYARPDLINSVNPRLCGWLGHRQPFAFEATYAPAEGIGRMWVGTPPIIQLAALDAALDIWHDVCLRELRQVSMQLSDLLLELVRRHCPQLQIRSPLDARLRGSHIACSFPEAYALKQALLARKVIVDFRAPDLLRFAIAPLYNHSSELQQAVAIMADIIAKASWDQPEFKQRAAVT